MDISPKLQATIDKVRKLIALTQNNNNENEVKSAQAQADRIMQQYRIDAAMLEAGGAVADPMVRRIIYVGGKRSAWREVILSAVCVQYGVCFYYSSGRMGVEDDRGNYARKGRCVYTCVGRESDIEILNFMFLTLCMDTERLCKEHAGKQGISFALSWMMGCAQGISSLFNDLRNEQKKATDGSNSAAMVLLGNRGQEARSFMNKEIPGLHTGAGISGGRNSSGRSQGFAVGRTVNISTRGLK